MSDPVFELWVYLSHTPLLWLCATLVAYAIADRVSINFRRHPLANPVLLAVLLLGGLLMLTGTPYNAYFEGAQFVHFLLGPATVALALPLYRNRRVVLRSLVPIVVSLCVGSAATIAAIVASAWAFDLPGIVLVSSLPKSTTSGVAMGISESTGGDPSLTAILVIATGICGAMIATPLLNALHIRDRAARGFGVGLASHGIGTARALQVDSLKGTFAGVAMGLNGVLTAVLVPIALKLLGY